VPAEVWQQVQLVYICSPGNPTARCAARRSRAYPGAGRKNTFPDAWTSVTREIYFDEQTRHPAAARWRTTRYRRLPCCWLFHSLFRSVPTCPACVPASWRAMARYSNSISSIVPTRAAPCRTHPGGQHHGWKDEAHVRANRDQYRPSSTPCWRSSHRS